MKIYVVVGRYLHTQAEANARARECGLKFDVERDTVEVPTDRQGLIAFLNALVEEASSNCPNCDDVEISEQLPLPLFLAAASLRDAIDNFTAQMPRLPLEEPEQASPGDFEAIGSDAEDLV